MVDLNVEGHNGFHKDFCDLYNLKNLIKVPTCFKNPDFPTGIDAMLIHVQLKQDYQIFIR